MKSFESSQGENKTYSIHVKGVLKRFPGREHQNVFKFLGEGKLNRGREFENVFKFPWGGGNLKTFSRRELESGRT